MHLILTPEDYAEFNELAKQQGTTTRILGTKVLKEYIQKTKSK